MARILMKVFVRRCKVKFVILYRQTSGFQMLNCTEVGGMLHLAGRSEIQQA